MPKDSATSARRSRRAGGANAVTAHGSGEATTAQVLPAALPDEVIDATMREVNELSRQADLDVSLRLGKLLVERFYGDDLGSWRARGSSDASFRKLAAHPELLASASGLYRAVAVFELCERLVGVSALKQLALGHLRAVLGLPEPQQRRLLTAASEKEWKVHKIEEEAAKIRSRQSDGRGRRPDPGFVKGIRRMGKLLQDDEGWFADLDEVESLDAKDAEALWKTVTGMKLKCEELQAKLASRVPGL